MTRASTTDDRGAEARSDTGARNAVIDRVEVVACKIPTDAPESDGTLEWDSTTIVIVHAWAAERWGVGYTYADTATARLIRDKLIDQVQGRSAMNVPAAWAAMTHKIRNDGRPGICSTAVSAVDNALWDLKAHLLGLPLVLLLGQVHEEVAIYGSGGFTSYDDRQLAGQLAGWMEQGMTRVKMKVGRDAEADRRRVALARQAIGDQVELFVDANGGYSRKQALEMAQCFKEDFNVSWFEEPRPSADLAGLRLLRNRGPAGMDIAAGEYGYSLPYFRQMIDAQAVDCLQADVTRCGGITGFLGVAALCEAALMPLSAHCAPAQSVHPLASVRPLRHLEYFHDHLRIEAMLFDGVLSPENGSLKPDLSRPGSGLTFKHQDAQPYEV